MSRKEFECFATIFVDPFPISKQRKKINNLSSQIAVLKSKLIQHNIDTKTFHTEPSSDETDSC